MTIMKCIILLICTLQVFHLVSCADTSSTHTGSKRKFSAEEEKGETNEEKEGSSLRKYVLPDITQKETDLEQEHMSIHPGEDEKNFYEKWPYLERIKPDKYCGDYFKDLFPNIEVEGLTSKTRKVPLRYRGSQSTPDVNVLILLCRLVSPYKQRTIYVITKAFEPQCVLALEPVFEQEVHYWFYIKDKRCNFERSDEVVNSANEAAATLQPNNENETVVVAQNQVIEELENVETMHNQNVQETGSTSRDNNELTSEELEMLRIEGPPSVSDSDED